MSSLNDIVGKVWKLCDVLRDDGITYHQYVNELTYLLFLKMAQETGTERLLLKGCRWADLASRAGDAEEQYAHYLHMLDYLGTKSEGRVKQIFANPTTFLHHAESLNKLVGAIDEIDWHAVGREGLGDVYEGVLQKNASEKKSGAGQYFTPRPLIDCIVHLLKPEAGEMVVDPAAGTAGFFISAGAYVTQHNSGAAKKLGGRPRFFGVELVRDTHRLALMNAMLHDLDGEIVLGDSLAVDGVTLPRADIVLTNPPFGSKRGAGRPMRADLPFPTANKQLAFLQLIYQNLAPGGRAGVVLPDNVLTEDGAAARVREDLMQKCNLHTILRLPTGIFYAQGVKTIVLFFARGMADTDNTNDIWLYDLRASMPSFGKRTPLTRDHFREFERLYGDEPDGSAPRDEMASPEGRFRRFTQTDLRARGGVLDFAWMKDASSGWDTDGDVADVVALLREKVQLALDELDALVAAAEGEEAAE